jgi:hypothetical protein
MIGQTISHYNMLEKLGEPIDTSESQAHPPAVETTLGAQGFGGGRP